MLDPAVAARNPLPFASLTSNGGHPLPADPPQCGPTPSFACPMEDAEPGVRVCLTLNHLPLLILRLCATLATRPPSLLHACGVYKIGTATF